MASTGRNDPCPCGSGKKAKRCCLVPPRERVDPVRQRIVALREDGLRRVLRAASGWCDREPRYKEAFVSAMEDLPAAADTPEGELFGGPWVAYHAEIDGRTPARRFLEESPALALSLRRWLEAECEAWPSYWEVVSALRGEGLELRDLLTGRQRFVRDRAASEDAPLRGGLLARVVEHEGQHWFSGIHPQVLPPPALSAVARTARRAIGIRGRCRPARLQADEPSHTLFFLWEETLDALRRRAAPALRNTEGDPLLLTRDRFLFDPPRRAEIRASLEALDGCDPETPGPHAQRGTLRFVLLSAEPDPNQPGHTILGNLELREDELILDTNSLPRADTHRARVERAAIGLLRHRSREHRDAWAAMENGEMPIPGAGTSDGATEPEFEEMLRELKRQHYARWLDDPIPALGHRTPRETAATPSGRRRVAEPLDQLEFSESQGPPGQRFDVAPLRADLGLER